MLNSDYREMLSILNEERVDYLIVGAYAMAAHGVPRRVVFEIEGLAIPFIGLAELKKNKLATGRVRDRLDVELLDERLS